MEIDRSSLIVSKAGRDKGQLFFVIDADEQMNSMSTWLTERAGSWRSQSAKSADTYKRPSRRSRESPRKFATARKYSIANYEKNWPVLAKNKVKTKGVN